MSVNGLCAAVWASESSRSRSTMSAGIGGGYSFERIIGTGRSVMASGDAPLVYSYVPVIEDPLRISILD